MATETRLYRPFTLYAAATQKAVSDFRGNWGLEARLAGNGDEYIERWDHLTQVTSLDSSTVTVTTTANFTIAQSFRFTNHWPETGSPTWSAWATVTTPNLQAAAVAGGELYFEWRYVRTNIAPDATEGIVGPRMLIANIDPYLPEFAGVVAVPSLYADIKPIAEAICTAASPIQPIGTVGERPLFAFMAGHPDKCNPDNRPLAYIYRIEAIDVYQNLDIAKRRVQFRIGLKRECDAGAEGWDAMRGQLKEYFGMNCNSFAYSARVRGVLNLLATPAQMGLASLRVIGDAEMEQGKCGCTRWEMTVEAKLAFELKNDLDL